MRITNLLQNEQRSQKACDGDVTVDVFLQRTSPFFGTELQKKTNCTLVLFHPASRASLNQIRLLGNCPSAPPLIHVFGLKSQVSEKHGVGVGWVGSFPDGGGEKEAPPESRQATDDAAAQTSGLVNRVFFRQTGF